MRLTALVVGLAAFAVLFPKVAPSLVAMVAVAPPADAVAPATPATGRRIVLASDSRGHYLVDAVIDGRSVAMMVDTGATIVALTGDTAHRLGIDPAPGDFTTPISTANGTVMSASVVLDEIKVGGIALRNVEAAVVPGTALPVNLLGMSFLGHLTRFEMAGGQIVLVQ